MALESSEESPIAVRTVAQAVAEWIGRLGSVWIEGQIAELKVRPGARLQYVTLRDTDVEMSLRVAVESSLLTRATPPIEPGMRVVVQARPSFWTKNGSLQFMASAIRTVGLGELLAQLERLRTLLAAEGLFAPERKQPLPFLPRTVGLICGRNSAARHDVEVNARERWPGLPFDVREVAVQGTAAVTEVIDALTSLCDVPDVDVIVIARGGGSVEDLLPFSNEALLRAVAACPIPVVSAIGHEQDVPLLDFVADARASTPTAAARMIAPSWDEQQGIVVDQRRRAQQALRVRLQRDSDTLTRARERLERAMTMGIDRRQADLSEQVALLGALSPQATLDRGYAIALLPDGRVLRDADEAHPGLSIQLRLARGTAFATVNIADPDSATGHARRRRADESKGER